MMRKPKTRRDAPPPTLIAGRYKIKIWRAKDGWWVATARPLVGAYGQGRTREEAHRSIVSAVRDLLATYRRDGLKPRHANLSVPRHTEVSIGVARQLLKDAAR